MTSVKITNLPKIATSNKENVKPSEKETTLTDQSNYNPVSGKKKAATLNASVPSTVKVPKINNNIKVKIVYDDIKMKDEVEDIKEGIVIENKY